MVLMVRTAYCVLRSLRSTVLPITLGVWIVVPVVALAGCRPTGPTPVEYTVPTAVRSTSTPVKPAVRDQPTLTPSPQPQMLTPTAPASNVPEPTSVKVVTRAGWNVFPLALGGRVLTPTAGQDAVLWVAPAGPGLGLYLHNLQSSETRQLATPSNAGGCVCRGYRQGDWVAMVETESGASWWEVHALDLSTGDTLPIGRTEDPATTSALRPGEFAVNTEGLVVWKDLATNADGAVVETLRLVNAATGDASVIISVRSPVRIDRVAMYGDWVVWGQATEDEAGTRGDLFAYDVVSGRLFPIGETGRAWEPAIWGTTVVWKHADGPFADGDVFLFDLETGEGRLLTEGGRVSAVGAGDGFVVWSSALEGIVNRHDLAANTDEIIGRGTVGWLAAGGNTAVWLLDGDPETLHVAWRR